MDRRVRIKFIKLILLTAKELYSVFVFYKTWNWIIVFELGLQPIGMIGAFGLSIFINHFKAIVHPPEYSEDKFSDHYLVEIVYYSFLLFLSWIYTLIR